MTDVPASAGKTPVGRSVRAPKTGELIAAQLRGRIVRGELVAGESLPSEPELMEQFEVSRPTLREAFRILETESLIMIKRGSRGARVMSPTVSVAARYVGVLLQIDGVTIADVYQARAVIEPAAVELLAANRTDADLAALAACADNLAALLDAPPEVADVGAWAAATQRFHETLVDRAGNKTLALQSRVLREVVATHLAVAVHRTYAASHQLETKNFRRSVRSYRKLVSLLEARDAEAAVKHWKVHMDVAGQALLRDGMSARTVLDLFT